MKYSFGLSVFSLFLFSLNGVGQEIQDAWDPNDDQYSGATILSTPSISDETHGPHTLSVLDPYDWFKISLYAHVSYEFYAEGKTDTAAELYASDGVTLLASDDDNGPGINFRLRYQPDQTDTYFLRVRMYAPTQEGSYILHMLARSGLEVPPDPWDPKDDSASGATHLGPFTPDHDFVPLEHGPHTLSNTDRADWFSLSLQASETYAFRSVGNSDLFAELFEDNGITRIASDDDSGDDENFRLVFTAPADRVYLLRVQAFEEGYIASYALQIQSGVEPLPAGDAWDPTDDVFDGSTELGAPTPWDQKQGPHTLSPTDRFDWYRLTLSAGVQYRFYSTGDSNPSADLYQDDGLTLLSTDDDSGTDANFSITFSPPTTEKYYLRVRSFQNGDASYEIHYLLENEPLPNTHDSWDPGDDTYPGAVALPAPSMKNQTHGPHSLSLTDLEDWFAFPLTAGTEYEFWSSGSSDTVGELFRPNGTTSITQEDEGGSGYNFRIRFSPLVDGTFYLRVRMFDRGSRGTYTLQYSQVSPIPSGADSWDPVDDTLQGASNLGAISHIESQHGPHTLSSTDTADWFKLTLSIGAVYEIYTTGDSDTQATLYHSDGQSIAVEQDDSGPGNNFKIYYAPAISGTYYLKISEYAEEQAAYTLRVFGIAEPVTDRIPNRIFTIMTPGDFIAIPGGYDGLAAGHVTVGGIPSNVYETTDGKGATLTTAPGQVMLLQFPPIAAEGKAVVLRAQVGSNGPGAAVALAALDGSLNGSIATNIPADSGQFQTRYQWMTLVYYPPGDSLIPIVQLDNTKGSYTLSLYLDTLEVYLIPKTEMSYGDNRGESTYGNFPASLLKPALISSSADWFPGLLVQIYPLTNTHEFTEQPGGFTNALPGSVILGDIPLAANTMGDGRGAILTASSGEVEMLLFPTIEVGDDLVLIRAKVKTSGAGASIALAALNGALDGSIATTISTDSSLFQEGYSWITLTYDSPGKTIVPLIQLAGHTQGSAVSLYVDTLEIYRFSQGSSMATRLLYRQ